MLYSHRLALRLVAISCLLFRPRAMTVSPPMTIQTRTRASQTWVPTRPVQ
jgi:hypothetical protein